METTAEDCISPYCRDMILLLSVDLVGFFSIVRHSLRGRE